MDNDVLTLIVALFVSMTGLYGLMFSIHYRLGKMCSLSDDVERIDKTQKRVVECLIRDGCDITLAEE